jgi:hypothetical protein
MERVPTVPILDKGLRAPLRSGLEAAVRAGVRRVAWVDSHYVQARFFCLVYHKLPPLCKVPDLQPLLPCASPGSHTAAHISQVFMDYCAPWRYRLHKAFRQDVIAVPVESLLASRQLFEMPFGRLCSFGLEGFGRFDPGLYYEIRHQTSADLFHRIIRHVMQTYAVLFVVLPAICTYPIERVSALRKRCCMRVYLL